MINKVTKLLQNLIKAPLLLLLFFYQKLISPLIGSRCRYYPSCSHYAVETLKRFNLPYAIYLIAHRLIRCSPLSDGGIDPVPSSNSKECRILVK
ncbi:MAG: membrane protein insertion efficiency factor YidD [Bdellovibrionales bacterium]|nr:membrane protein insertion efficiency factor YidD [Bdellovibrionales bacterium]MBT3525507.1 membrane protein insertion efficiency factor YidD [Bdellovibrionales bacterium]MBT7670420.1 membrane protein insertion efficiency factor YidD [Bdellovibrionales bacterium]MBT7765641.1 membrane protein insertion efficiency factor YidD [Bdellovibrionales bacterium]